MRYIYGKLGVGQFVRDTVTGTDEKIGETEAFFSDDGTDEELAEPTV